jgi:hypothetical protein
MFPQINANCIMTQLPYASELDYVTISQDVETGMRYTFPLRGAGLPSMPSGPLGKFQLTFPTITDAEVATLQAFYASMRGRWGQFGLMDPGGNLLQYSNDWTQSVWAKSGGVFVSATGQTDPFGGGLAQQLTAGSGDSSVLSSVGPSTGGMSGYVLCASSWVMSPNSGQSAFVGFANSLGVLQGVAWSLQQNVWRRIYYSAVLGDNNAFRIVIGGNSSWSGGKLLYLFGAKVCSTKGPGAYCLTPGNYAWHPNCRFSTDVFERRVLGPNQNSVSLPVEEFFVA